MAEAVAILAIGILSVRTWQVISFEAGSNQFLLVLPFQTAAGCIDCMWLHPRVGGYILQNQTEKILRKYLIIFWGIFSYQIQNLVFFYSYPKWATPKNPKNIWNIWDFLGLLDNCLKSV